MGEIEHAVLIGALPRVCQYLLMSLPSCVKNDSRSISCRRYWCCHYRERYRF